MWNLADSRNANIKQIGEIWRNREISSTNMENRNIVLIRLIKDWLYFGY